MHSVLEFTRQIATRTPQITQQITQIVTSSPKDPMDERVGAPMRARIEATLAALAAEKGVRVLFAVESGSRAWGMASPDSDYDVRGVFCAADAAAHAADEGLKCAGLQAKTPKDILFMSEDRLVDVNLWSIDKLIDLLHGGNSVALEWARSPVTYVTTPLWPRVLQDELVVPEPAAALSASRAHFMGLMASTHARAIKDSRFDAATVKELNDRVAAATAALTKHKQACIMFDWTHTAEIGADIARNLEAQEAAARASPLPRRVTLKKICYPVMAALNLAFLCERDSLPPLDITETLAALGDSSIAPSERAAIEALLAKKRAGAEAEAFANEEDIAYFDAFLARTRQRAVSKPAQRRAVGVDLLVRGAEGATTRAFSTHALLRVYQAAAASLAEAGS